MRPLHNVAVAVTMAICLPVTSLLAQEGKEKHRHEQAEKAHRIEIEKAKVEAKADDLHKLLDELRRVQEGARKDRRKESEHAKAQSRTYTVKKGDTLKRIAKKECGKGGQELLLSWNPGLNAQSLRVGQKIKLPAAGVKGNKAAEHAERAVMEALRAHAGAERDAMLELRKKHEEVRREAQKVAEESRRNGDQVRIEFEGRLAKERQRAEREVEKVARVLEREVAKANFARDKEMQKMQLELKRQAEHMHKQHEKEFSKARSEAKKDLARAREDLVRKLFVTQETRDRDVQKASAEAEANLQKARHELERHVARERKEMEREGRDARKLLEMERAEIHADRAEHMAHREAERALGLVEERLSRVASEQQVALARHHHAKLEHEKHAKDLAGRLGRVAKRLKGHDREMKEVAALLSQVTAKHPEYKELRAVASELGAERAKLLLEMGKERSSQAHQMDLLKREQAKLSRHRSEMSRERSMLERELRETKRASERSAMRESRAHRDSRSHSDSREHRAEKGGAHSHPEILDMVEGLRGEIRDIRNLVEKLRAEARAKKTRGKKKRVN